MAKMKEPQIYWKVGVKGEKHDVPSGATVVFKSPDGSSVTIKIDAEGINVVER
jgi:hypothetical protein